MNAPCSGAPLTAPHVTTGGLCRWKAINKVGRHVGLDFYDLLIEALKVRLLSIQFTSEAFGNRSEDERNGGDITSTTAQFSLRRVHVRPDNRLAGEKIYYDRAMVLRQLGVFHEPQTVLGGISILLTHPLTILQLSRDGFVETSGDSNKNL